MCGVTVDGRPLLASGGDDDTVRLWDPRTSICLLTAQTHNKVLAVAGIADSLAIGGLDIGILVIRPTAVVLASLTRGLLAMLLGHGLVRQPEVVVTRSLAWLCSLPGAGAAMDALIQGAGLEPGESPSWHAEVRAASGARTDLECWWGEPPLPRVVVEAKLGALLSAGQIADYIPR